MRNNIIPEILKSMLEDGSHFRAFLETYSMAITVFLTLATLAVIIMLIFNITKVGASSTNASKREEGINGIFICTVALIILGGFDVVYAILVNLIQNNM